MRLLVVAVFAGLALAGCSRMAERAVADHAAAPGQGWTMQVLGTEKNQVFVVTGPAGQTAAARVVEGGEATLLADTEAAGLMAQAQTAVAANAPPERVSIAAPGVSIKVAGDDASGDAGAAARGRVAIDVGGVSVHVDGDDGGDRGTVRIAGVDADTAVKFIDDIDGLPPEVKAQMRAKLGL